MHMPKICAYLSVQCSIYCRAASKQGLLSCVCSPSSQPPSQKAAPPLTLPLPPLTDPDIPDLQHSPALTPSQHLDMVRRHTFPLALLLTPTGALYVIIFISSDRSSLCYHMAPSLHTLCFFTQPIITVSQQPRSPQMLHQLNSQGGAQKSLFQ